MLVSVIIPTFNEVDCIVHTLAAARRDYAPDEVEIVVVDGGSSDGTLDLISPYVTVIQAAPGRGHAMNCGAAVAGGQILVFCHGDTQLPPGWRSAVIEALGRPGVSAGSFAVRFLPARGFLHLLNHLWYPADWRLMYGDQAPFMTRETFTRAGGFPEIPLMEDLEMMRTLHRLGRLVRIPQRVTSSSRRFLARGPLRLFLLDVCLVIRYLYFGATPQEIAARYCVTTRDRVPPGEAGAGCAGRD